MYIYIYLGLPKLAVITIAMGCISFFPLKKFFTFSTFSTVVPSRLSGGGGRKRGYPVLKTERERKTRAPFNRNGSGSPPLLQNWRCLKFYNVMESGLIPLLSGLFFLFCRLISISILGVHLCIFVCVYGGKKRGGKDYLTLGGYFRICRRGL